MNDQYGIPVQYLLANCPYDESSMVLRIQSGGPQVMNGGSPEKVTNFSGTCQKCGRTMTAQLHDDR